MADAVVTTVLDSGPRNHKVRLNNRSDGTGESEVTKVDASTIEGPEGPGTTVGSFTVARIEFAVQGMTRVDLLFDATTDDVFASLNPGNGFIDYHGEHLPDPRSTGFTGDINLTTVGALGDGSYEITLFLIKKA